MPLLQPFIFIFFGTFTNLLINGVFILALAGVPPCQQRE